MYNTITENIPDTTKTTNTVACISERKQYKVMDNSNSSTSSHPVIKNSRWYENLQKQRADCEVATSS